MERSKIPEIIFRLARRHGLVLIHESDIETQVTATMSILSAAFVMYDALEQITMLDNRAAPNAAALIARRAKKEVEERVMHAQGGA